MPSILEDVESKIQSKVAEFLAAKEKILRATKSDDPLVVQKANELWSQQLRLEDALKVNLNKIEQFKKGVWTAGDILNIGTFAASLNSHLKKVRKLNLPETLGDQGVYLAKWVFGGAAAVLMFVYLWRGTGKK